MKISKLSLLIFLLNLGVYSMAPDFMHQNTNVQEEDFTCKSCGEKIKSLCGDCLKWCCMPCIVCYFTNNRIDQHNTQYNYEQYTSRHNTVAGHSTAPGNKILDNNANK